MTNRGREIGRHVRMMRDARGLTMEDLGARVGMTKGAVSEHEAGKRRFEIAVLDRFAAAMGTTSGRLLDGPVPNRLFDLAGLDDADAAALEIIRDSLAARPR